MGDSPRSTRPASPSQFYSFGAISPPAQNSSRDSDDGEGLQNLNWEPLSPPPWAAASFPDQNISANSNDGTYAVAQSAEEASLQLIDPKVLSKSGSSSHRSSLSALSDDGPKKHDDVPPKKEKRGYRLSEKYLEYRAQLQQDTGKDGVPIWSDEVEDALHRGEKVTWTARTKR